MKVINIQICADWNSKDLSSIVQTLVEKGWEPFGGVAVSVAVDSQTGNVSRIYAQTMVLYAAKNPCSTRGQQQQRRLRSE